MMKMNNFFRTRYDFRLQCFVVYLLLLVTATLWSQTSPQASPIPYGQNPAVGRMAPVNGFNMYYEVYGSGAPLFLIHGNGGNISSMKNQIDYFKQHYRVIVADSRGHGRSELRTDSLTYRQMADDWAALADYLHLDSLYVIGWSDGGIIGLLLAIEHPSKVKKMVTMGANLQPDTSAVYDWAVNWVARTRKIVEQKIDSGDTSQNWPLLRQHLQLLGDQPHIALSEIESIRVPVLIVAGDKDIIREEHSVRIFQHLRKGHLAILPGATHYAPATKTALFNATAERFFSEPFKRPDSDWTKGH
ncbi:MAG: alpha/beta hydrolase [Calditrichaeota bacterium]|nr:MAG: alpha/beta hydrolase [Calditrichota bacterium]